MSYQQLPIVGGFYKDPDLHWSRQDCLNWIPVKAERPGTLTEWILRDAPGLKAAVQIHAGTGGIRGARNVEGKLFVVTGQTLYQISNAGVAIPRGTVPGVGRVSMAHNAKGLGNELLVVNGSAGYVYDTTTMDFSKVTDEAYPGAFVADFVDQFLPQVEPQGRYWFNSDLANAHAYSGLDRYQAEGDPDRIVSMIVSHREVLVLGKRSIEPYVNVGGATGTFQRASNTVIECGCAARFTPRRLDNSVFWLDDHRLVRRLNGYTPEILSTDAIAAAFAECSDAEVAQSYAFTWEGDGYKTYYVTVPNRFTFGYDAKTGEWHRRGSYGLAHWAVSEIVEWNGKWYACDSRFPRLYELDALYKLDGCDPLVRKRTAGVLWAEQNTITLDELEIMFGTPAEASVCVAFPGQPEGPSITGAAPDVGPGASLSYPYTITPGDAPIAYATMVSGPAWLTMSAAGELSGTAPLEIATYPITLRVYDTNGLWDELDDEVEVTLGEAIPIPTVKTLVQFITGGGATNIASENIASGNFDELTDTSEPWVRMFVHAYDSDAVSDGSIPPETRLYVYDEPNQGGEVYMDLGWRGNPAHQSAMGTALSTAGLSSYAGTITDTPMQTYGTYPSFVYANAPFAMPADYSNYSARTVIYRAGVRLDNQIYVEAADPAEMPVDALKLEGYPGYYVADGQLYACAWDGAAP